MDFIMADISNIQELTKMRIAYIKDEQNNISDQEEQIMIKRLPEYFEKHLGKDLFAFVAKENDKIVATAFLLVIEKPSNPHFINGLMGNVLNVYTMPPYRRKGISTKLLENLILFAKEHRLDFIELKATKEGYSMYKDLEFKDYHSEYTDMRLFI